MKTIHSISTLALASLSLAFTAHAQAPMDPEGRPGRPGPDEWESARKLMQDRASDQMMFPGKVRPLERRRAEMKIQQLTEPDSKEINVAPTWRIGVMVEPLDPFVRLHLGLPDDAGVRVSMVSEGDPAAAAGIEVNDIIVVAGDRKIANLEGLRDVVEKSAKEGRPIMLQIIHRGERKPVVLQARGPKPEVDPEARPERDRDREQGRPFVEMQRRLDRQDKMIQELRSELKKLRKQVQELQKDEDDEEEEDGE